MAGVSLQPGTYTLFTLPSQNAVALVINGQSGQWGTQYDASRDIARLPMTVDSTPANVEQFTIRVDGAEAGASRLVMEWGRLRWSALLRAKPGS